MSSFRNTFAGFFHCLSLQRTKRNSNLHVHDNITHSVNHKRTNLEKKERNTAATSQLHIDVRFILASLSVSYWTDPNMGVRRGGQFIQSPGFWIKVYLGEHFFSTAASCSHYSCQLQSLQLPAALKKGYYIALLALNFQIFSRSRANRPKINFCGRSARKMVDIFTFS